jgi:hypothetical protein
MVRKLTAVAALAMLASCAPETQAPVKVRALVRSSNGAYEPQEVELKTVTNIVSLEGKVARLVGGASVRLDPNDPELQAATTEEAVGKALVKKEGRPVTASYITDAQGVLWPADFHTWNLVTTYYNFERAWDYFQITAGLREAELPQTTAYYFPEFVLADVSADPQLDNALFFAPTKSFLVLPFQEVQTAPLALNASILTHEYAHLVFNRRVYGGSALPQAILSWSLAGGQSTPGLNVLKSMDEGLADFHAYAASCESRFGCNTRILSSSFEGTTVDDRDLTNPRNCMTQELYQQLQVTNFAAFSGREYQVGTMIATALFKAAGNQAERQVLAKAVADAYSDTNVAKPGLAQLTRNTLADQSKFTLGVAVRAIVQHLPPGAFDLRNKLCTQLATHLLVPVSELSQGQDACPGSTNPSTCGTTTP